MPLPVPQLDDRTFEQLVTEARARIPRFTPEWTNFNDSDPGMTLVKLHAWLTETILYRLNKLPELNYLKFLELLNVQPRPAVAARAQLTFTLKKLNKPTDPLVTLVAKGTQVGVDDPDLTEELLFETDRTLTALNAVLAAIIVPGTDDTPKQLVTEYDADAVEVKIPLPFYPFGKTLQLNAICLLGMLLRPHRQQGQDYSLDRFPAGELDLTALVPEVFESNAEGNVISGPQALDCLFPWQVTAQSELIIWEAYTGTEHVTQFENPTHWREISVLDETAALTRSGHVYLDVPGGLPVVSFKQLSRSLWADLGLFKPPTSAAELAEDILGSEGFVLEPAKLDKSVWETLGLTDQVLTDFCTLVNDPNTPPEDIADFITAHAAQLDFTKVDDAVWTDEAIGYSEPPVPYELTWFRARLLALPDDPPQVSQFLLNTVAATAAVTRVEEVVGVSTGRPNQTYTLRRAPVLVLPDPATGAFVPQLELVIDELGQPEVWTVVTDFYGISAEQAVFAVDSPTGTITLGDGIHGRIPVAGAEIKARRYRYGGGQVGNVGVGTITTLRSVLPDVDRVTNVRAAAGGANAEALEEVMLRAPHDLRMRDRAVTQDDFAELALRTPGVRIQRAYALPLTRADLSTDPPTLVSDTPGAVTVVILPENKEETPQPTEEQLRLVCAHVNSRRLITTELYVIGPRYVEITQLEAEVLVSRSMDVKAVTEAITGQLLTYFHPLHGGEEGRGWPFGQHIYMGQVYRQMLNVLGVVRVLCLNMTAAQGTGICDDVLTVAAGALVHLPRTAMNLKVKYDPAS
jgi:hypothetical protein